MYLEALLSDVDELRLEELDFLDLLLLRLECRLPDFFFFFFLSGLRERDFLRPRLPLRFL